jgi:hypothetical protein
MKMKMIAGFAFRLAFARKWFMTGFFVLACGFSVTSGWMQSSPPGQANVTKSAEGKKEEAERAAARATAHHFDRGSRDKEISRRYAT